MAEKEHWQRTGAQWELTELLDVRDVLLGEWARLGSTVYQGPTLRMLGDVYRDLVAVAGKAGADLAMAQRDQEMGRCRATTT
jgi:hypothetical protein